MCSKSPRGPVMDPQDQGRLWLQAGAPQRQVQCLREARSTLPSCRGCRHTGRTWIYSLPLLEARTLKSVSLGPRPRVTGRVPSGGSGKLFCLFQLPETCLSWLTALTLHLPALWPPSSHPLINPLWSKSSNCHSRGGEDMIQRLQ